jgi:hypothetical protein
MRGARVLLVLFAAVVAQSAFAGFQGYTTLSHSDTSLTSATDVSYIFDSVICAECSYQMLGDHWIRESNGGGAIAGQQWGVYGTEYRNTLTADGAPGSCYYATNAASMTLYGCNSCPGPAPGGPYTFDHGGPWESSSVCIPAPPPPIQYRLQVWTCLDGSCTLSNDDLHDAGSTVGVWTSGPANYQFNGWSGDVISTSLTAQVYMDRDKSVSANWSSPSPPPPDTDPLNNNDNSSCPQYQNCNSPIVINLGGGYELSDKNDPVMFDIDADGTPNRLAWTAAGAPMAFLALDRNTNGKIDDGAELFGNHTPLWAGVAPNGFAALAQYDANHDGIIDANDPIWSSLLLWTDLNHDGISQPAEIMPLSVSEVTAIDLDYHWTGRRDVSGNTFRYESHVRMDNTRHGDVRPVYDIYFVAVP